MRLSDLEKKSIVKTAKIFFGDDVKIFLFGSRVMTIKRAVILIYMLKLKLKMI